MPEPQVPEVEPEVPFAPEVAPIAAETGTSCPHSAREDLGLGGSLLFLRCGTCGDVLVVGGGRVWRVGSADSSTGSELTCA